MSRWTECPTMYYFAMNILFTGILLVLYCPSGIAASQSATGDPCRVRAWVRAQDLDPGQVVQGDVRVKVDGSCDDVLSYSLGLRFAERSWVKTRRENVELPERPSVPWFPFTQSSGDDDSVYENAFDSTYWPQIPGNQSSWEQYTSYIKDPALWTVHEEERIGFEANYTIHTGDQVGHSMVEPFAILVPSTNYPPGFDMSMGLPFLNNEVDSAGSEHIYAYFVDVKFSNGTSERIPAGYTSFNAIIPHASPASQTINVTATGLNRCAKGSGCDVLDETLRDEFTLEITFPSGRHVEAGSDNKITIISHQVGPGLQRPLEIQDLRSHVSQKRRWAAKHAVDNKTATELLDAGFMYQTRLWPVHDDEFHTSRVYGQIPQKPMRFAQSNTPIIENGTIFTTEAITAQFKVVEQSYPPFETYYQTTEAELDFRLQVQNISSKNAEPSDAEDEYDWIPTLRGKEPYQWGEVLHAKVPIFIHPKSDDHASAIAREVTHYLSPEARAPIFVNPSSVARLLDMTPDARDDLAPLAQATFVTHTDSEVVRHRYYKEGAWRGLFPKDGLHYVGDTWLRKVLRREGEDKTS